jgi:glycolate oxidase FAD binding subunit
MSLKDALTAVVQTVGAANIAPALPANAAASELKWKPQATVSPANAAELAQVVTHLESAGAAVVPLGGGTQIHVGYPPASDRTVFVVRTSRLNRVLDFQPDDMTVTVEPGITLSALQKHLAARKQMLALDVPFPERATLGGIVSAATSGFWRPAYGAPRDLLIGVQALMTGGVEVKGGGKVVKNVAGYDICKLFTGAWGTLGIITEMTFRVRPRPETERVLCWQMPNLATAAKLGFDLHQAQLAPTFISFTNELNGVALLLVGLQGDTVRVQWQADEFGQRLRAAGISEEPTLLDALQYETLRNGQARNTSYTPIAAHVSCLPTDLPALIARLEPLLTFPRLRVTAHCATGLLSLAAIDVPPGTLTQFLALFPNPSRVAWLRLDENRDNIEPPLWGEEQGDFFLHRALKQKLDPQNTFSPGRFYGQI